MAGRSIAIALLEACEDAVRSMAGNDEYRSRHEGVTAGRWENWVMWWRGFVGGLVGDRQNHPLYHRLGKHFRLDRLWRTRVRARVEER